MVWADLPLPSENNMDHSEMTLRWHVDFICKGSHWNTMTAACMTHVWAYETQTERSRNNFNNVSTNNLKKLLSGAISMSTRTHFGPDCIGFARWHYHGVYARAWIGQYTVYSQVCVCVCGKRGLYSEGAGSSSLPPAAAGFTHGSESQKKPPRGRTAWRAFWHSS